MSSPTPPPPYLGALGRIAIRRHFERAIKGATLAQKRVFRSRLFPIELHDADGKLRLDVLPAILIYTGDEDLERFNSAPIETQRTLQIWVEIIAQVREEFDDVLDVISAEVERVIELDERLGDRCEETVLGFVERNQPEREGAIALASARMRWDVVYHTQADDVELAIPDLLTLQVQYDLAPPDETIEATDSITVQTP